MVEVVLGKLFALPVPTEIEVFYGALLLELCKLQPSTLPQVVSFEQFRTVSNSSEQF